MTLLTVLRCTACGLPMRREGERYRCPRCGAEMVVDDRGREVWQPGAASGATGKSADQLRRAGWGARSGSRTADVRAEVRGRRTS